MKEKEIQKHCQNISQTENGIDILEYILQQSVAKSTDILFSSAMDKFSITMEKAPKLYMDLYNLEQICLGNIDEVEQKGLLEKGVIIKQLQKFTLEQMAQTIETLKAELEGSNIHSSSQQEDAQQPMHKKMKHSPAAESEQKFNQPKENAQQPSSNISPLNYKKDPVYSIMVENPELLVIFFNERPDLKQDFLTNYTKQKPQKSVHASLLQESVSTGRDGI